MFNLVKERISQAEKTVLEVQNQAEELNKLLQELHPSIRVDSVSVCHLFRGVRYFLWVQGIGYPNTIDIDNPTLLEYVEKQLNNLILQSDV